MDTSQSTADQLGAPPLTGSYGPAMVRGTIADIEQAQKQKEAAQAPVYAKMKSDMARDQARFDDVAKNYTPFQPTPAPQQPPNDPLAAFSSAGAVFAALASAFTHTPAINAMNAMAGAINARRNNDWQSYQANYKTWKDNTEIALQNHKLQAQDMKDAMEMMQTDLTTGVAMAKAVAAQSEDHIATRLLEQGQLKELSDHQLAAARAGAAMQESALRIQEMHMKIQEEQQEHGLRTDLMTAIKSGDTDAVSKAATAYAQYRNPEAFAAAQKEQKARDLAGDAASYDEQGKLKPEVERKLRSLDPNLALQIQRADQEKLSTPKEYISQDGKTHVNVRFSQSGPVDAATNLPVNLSGMRPATGAGMSGRNELMLQRGFVNAKDAVTDLKNVAELPITIDTGMFGHRTVGGPIMDASKEVLANKVTAEDAQAYNAALAGLERALGGLSTGGLQVNESTMASFGQLNIQKGDSNFIKLRKLATMRQNVENALDAMAVNPQLTTDQTKLISDLRTELEQAIPWTPHDVNQVEFSQDPNVTVSQFAKQKLGGGQGLTEGQTGTSKSGKPIIVQNGQWVYQ